MGSGSIDNPYVLQWLQNDPDDPYNWPTCQKWVITAQAGIDLCLIPFIHTALQLALATWTVSFSSSAYSGGLEHTMRDLHVSYNVATLGISLYVLGFALGFVLVHSPLFQILTHPSPLLFASMGEVTIFRSSPASFLAHQTSLPFPNLKQRCTEE